MNVLGWFVVVYYRHFQQIFSNIMTTQILDREKPGQIYRSDPWNHVWESGDFNMWGGVSAVKPCLWESGDFNMWGGVSAVNRFEW